MRAPRSDGLQLLLVDDHAIVREGIKRILLEQDQGWRIDEAQSGAQALERLRHAPPVDVAIVDISLPDMSGLELIRRIKQHHPATGVLVLSMHAEEQYALRAFKAGANGYVTKDSATKELVTAISKLSQGGAYVTPGLAERVVQALNGEVDVPSHALLSDRELEVLLRLVDGQRQTEIAQALHVSVKTISTHKSRIQEKLKLPNLAALVRYGLEHKLGRDDSLQQ